MLDRHISKAAVVVTLSAALATAAVRAPQVPEWRTARPLSDTEKTDVIALAAKLNVSRPESVRTEFIHSPLTCESLRIDSVPLVTGNRRAWQRVWVTKSSYGCPTIQRDSPRVGEWFVIQHTQEVGAWRVPREGGFLDVETPSSVPYADVTAIVSAIQSEHLVNRLPTSFREKDRTIPKVDAGAIVSVWDGELDRSLLTVRFRATAVVFVVAVHGGVVELRDWRTEVS